MLGLLNIDIHAGIAKTCAGGIDAVHKKTVITDDALYHGTGLCAGLLRIEKVVEVFFDKLFGLLDAEGAFACFCDEKHTPFVVINLEYGTGMAFAEGIAVYRLARFGREAEHTELIGNKALALAETIRKLILSEIETINKGFITFRLLKEIEILALEVLDDCHESRIGGRGVALDDAGNGLPAEHANRAPFPCLHYIRLATM